MTNFYYLNKFNIGGTSFLNNSSEFPTNNVVSNILRQNAYDVSQQLQFISSNDDVNDNNGFDSFYSQYANIIGSDILSYTNQYVTTNDMALGNLINDQTAISSLVADKTQFYFNKTADGELYRYTSKNHSNIADIDLKNNANFDDLLVGYEKYAKYIQDKLEGNPDVDIDDVESAANLQALGIDYNSIKIGKTQEDITAIYQNIIDQIISEAKAIKPSTISKDDRIALEKDLETKEQELSTLDNLLFGTSSEDTTYVLNQYKLDLDKLDMKTKTTRDQEDITTSLNTIVNNAQINTQYEYSLDTTASSTINVNLNTLINNTSATPDTSKPITHNITGKIPDYIGYVYFASEEDKALMTTTDWSIDKVLKTLGIEFYVSSGSEFKKIVVNKSFWGNSAIYSSEDGKYLFESEEMASHYNSLVASNDYNFQDDHGNSVSIIAYSFDGTNVNRINISKKTSIDINFNSSNIANSLNRLDTDLNNKNITNQIIVDDETKDDAITGALKLMRDELIEERNKEAGNWIKTELTAQKNFNLTGTSESAYKATYNSVLSGVSSEKITSIITTVDYLVKDYTPKLNEKIGTSTEYSFTELDYFAEILNYLSQNIYDGFSPDEKNVIVKEVINNLKLHVAAKLMENSDYAGNYTKNIPTSAESYDDTNWMLITAMGSDYNTTIKTNEISGISTTNDTYNTGLLKINTNELKQLLKEKMKDSIHAENIAQTIIDNLSKNDKLISKVDDDVYINIELYKKDYDIDTTATGVTNPEQWVTNFINTQINALDITYNENNHLIPNSDNSTLLNSIKGDDKFDSIFSLLDNSAFVESHNTREEKFDIMTLADRTFNGTGYNNYLEYNIELMANTYLNENIIDENGNVIVPKGLLTKTYRLNATVLDNDENYVSGPRLKQGTILPVGTKQFEKSSLINKLTQQLTSFVSAGDEDGDIDAASYVARAILGIIEDYLAENFNKQNPESIETYFAREFATLFNPNNKEGIIDVVINKNGTYTPQVIKMDFRVTENGVGKIVQSLLSSQTFYEIGSKLEDRTRKEMELFESATALDIVQNINTQEYIYRLNILAGLEKINEEQGLGLDFSMVNKTLVSLGAGSSSNPWWQEYFPWFKGFYGNIPEGATAEDMFDENGNLTGLGQVGGMTIDPYILKINGVDYVLGKDNNQDGKINDATEILGIEDKIEDNFASLEALDIDKDGYISNEELKKGNIILQAVNQNERLNGASMSIDFVNGISLSSLKKENGTNNIYGTFSADMKNGSTVSGIQTFEQENYFHNLFGTYTDLSFLNKAETTTENQETTEEKTEETQIKYMAGVFSKKFSFLSNVESNSTEISVDKLIEDISWKLSIDNLSASQRYDIIDDIDITRSEDVITTEIENKLEQIKFSA